MKRLFIIIVIVLCVSVIAGEGFLQATQEKDLSPCLTWRGRAPACQHDVLRASSSQRWTYILDFDNGCPIRLQGRKYTCMDCMKEIIILDAIEIPIDTCGMQE